MHEYMRRKFLAMERGIYPFGAPGTVSEGTICHDDWCEIYKGGECHCDPEITITGPEGSFQILANGDVLKAN